MGPGCIYGRAGRPAMADATAACGLELVGRRFALGRLMFQIIGAMAEFERALIQERVRAGLRNARAKGKRLGRPRHSYPQGQVERLRADGLSWGEIAKRTGIPKATLLRKRGAG